ncbi:FkbM family methyltransferase [Phytohabitans sp. ZYX-F-186]|uniref:FkbM family methyltransferase n=1 Tax=Phytohabitans maris TaxID=3071409 RepID=A0ABU0ZAH9_9ACTN|nr:FkbM family methyltransferase [Phytohabitans sp. ZYX-F-186]MDQ7904062.1 FkbM family methyltransferase [Phytohabitans sp. ZYX-F-186]
MAGTLSMTLRTRLPAGLMGAAIRAVYPRVEPELARLHSYAPRGGTAVDVGAWYGPWTRRLRRLADRVVALEPAAELAELVAEAYPDVRVVRAAASDHAGTATLHLPEGGAAVGTSSVEHGDGRPVLVPRVTVDGLELTDVRFMKIDVEGHELAVLRGAERTIRRDAPLLLVEVEERIQPVGPILALLRGWGYRPYVMPRGRWLPLDGFDLVAHQRAAVGRVRQSFARRLVAPWPRYVNLVLFKPEPRGPATREHEPREHEPRGPQARAPETR